MPQTLDLRTIPPSRQRARVFEAFDALAPGETMDIVDDHDPMPLYFRLERRHDGAFGWRYLDTGPACWRVRLQRLPGTGSPDPPDPAAT